MLAVFRGEELPVTDLAAAVLIELRRVKGADPALDCRLDDGLRVALVGPADVGAADGQHGDPQPGFPERAPGEDWAELVGGRLFRGALARQGIRPRR